MGIRSIHNVLQFHVERLILRGALHRLLFVAIVIALISIVSGFLVFCVASGFKSGEDAVWWAFLRLTDPGYLGEDEGRWKRTISTILTILGYVLFMGALIAILTQWLHETIDRLQSGLTPIYRKNHILILGWNERTPCIVEQLLLSEGLVKRFLKRQKTRRLHIVILSEEVRPAMMQALRDSLGSRFNPNQVTFRTGTPLQVEHLQRVDYLRAAVILLPADVPLALSTDSPDGRIIKTVVMTSHASEGVQAHRPLMIAEIVDARHKAITERSYRGPIEVICCDTMASRIMAQIIRRPGLSFVIASPFVRESENRIYVRESPELADRTIVQLQSMFPRAVPVGCARHHDGQLRTIINPPADFRLRGEDRLFFIARSYEDTQPQAAAGQAPVLPPVHPPSQSEPAEITRRKVLVLGWNRIAPALVRELDSYGMERFEVDVISTLPSEQRLRHLEQHDVRPKTLILKHHERDFTSSSDLASIEPSRFHNILLLADDRLDSEAESEARTLLGYLVLQDVLKCASSRPHILVELMNEEHRWLFEREGDEVIPTPQVLSFTLSQVALRRELNSMFEELFGAGGPELAFRPLKRYGLQNRQLHFGEIQLAALAHGETALGIRMTNQIQAGAGGVLLNPDRGRLLNLDADDQIVVVSRL